MIQGIMREITALKIIYWLSLLGVLFSGYLSYSELFKGVCLFGGCPVLSGIPACVYGFAMFVVIFVISILGVYGKR